ncbi:hypothetical protein EVJ50_13820 [Synechococcus sp. RSCCF101]|uniref:hypothetical protein n=1 Tax=Synechococcus sp. RSCCF101 TaxID=2511069 RepID=UPI00124782A4|nr:hypothetical protein [Synechococcus sp. RSCCF101]QEY33152.1 hypothetical protein EVJ50_13820 [Synechococcus sp. RSCCF101]
MPPEPARQGDDEPLRPGASLSQAWDLFHQAPWRFLGLSAAGSAAFIGLGLLARALQESERGARGALLIPSLVLTALSLTMPPLTVALVMRFGDGLEQRSSGQPPLPEALRRALLVPALQILLVAGLALLALGGWVLIQPLSDFAGLVLLAAVGLVALEQIITQLFALPMAVLTRRGPFEAIRSSHRVLAAHRFEATLLLLLMVAVAAGGLLLMVGGVLISLPMAILIQISCFRRWQRRHSDG